MSDFLTLLASVEFDLGQAFPVNTHQKIKVHLCDDCYHAPHEIKRRTDHEIP